MSDVSRRELLQTAGMLGVAAATAGTADAQGRPSADDLIRAAKGARMFDLSFVWNEQSPVLGLNPPYAFALNRTHKMTHEIFGQVPGSRVSWASDIMYFSGQHGAPTIDAIGHIGRDLKLHGGVDAVAATATPGASARTSASRASPRTSWSTARSSWTSPGTSRAAGRTRSRRASRSRGRTSSKRCGRRAWRCGAATRC